MLPELERVARLQTLDQRAADLQKEIAALPKHIAAIEKLLEGHLRRLEADRAAVAANQRERKKLDGDVQTQQAKISKLRDQMLQAKTNEQYRAFQSEIEYCEKEIRKCEDRTLELMSESEPLEGAVKSAEVALKQEKEQVEGEKKTARERSDKDKKALEEVKTERAALVATISSKLMRDYVRIHKKWPHGPVVADATEGSCSACQIVLRPQFFQDLRRGDEVMFCESCGRILTYNPPVVVDAEVGGPATSPTT